MNGKICPLLSIGGLELTRCQGERCAWWDCLTNTCCIAAGTDYIQAVADAINQKG